MGNESGSISLARYSPFAIGAVRVDPAAREVSLGGACETIEPLVMQVLVVLAENKGSVVPRDTLIDRCWDGRAISEDALNRVIAKVRRLAAGIGGDLFRIETVTKVGYRLQLGGEARAGSARPVATSGRPDRPTAAGRRPLWAALGIALIIGASLFMVLPQQKPQSVSKPQATAPVVIAATDLETRGLSLMFQGTAEQTADGIEYLRQATVLSPDHAPLWGSLAMGYVLDLPFVDAANSPVIARRANEAAKRALALDPHEGRAIAALISLQPTFRHWAEKDAALLNGLAIGTPETPPLMFQRIQFLASVGRTDEALVMVERLSTISPLLPWIQSARANLLAAAGRLDDAQQVADRAAQTWPHDRLTWFTRFNFALYGGRPKDALAMAEVRSQWPVGSQSAIENGMAIADTLIDGSPGAADRLIERLSASAGADREAAEMAVQAAMALDRPDLAVALARQMYERAGALKGRGVVFPRVGRDDGTERNTALLFLPPTARLRSNPGFANLVRDLGLVNYWQRAKIGPSRIRSG